MTAIAEPELMEFDPAEVARCERIDHEERQSAFTPIRPLDIYTWAKDNLWMSPEENDGRLEKYDPDLTPWHRDIMDAMGSLRIRKVIAMLPAQVGGKTTLMKADLGARICDRPSPIIWGVPRSNKDVKTWSKDRVDPMFRDVPILRGRVATDTRNKDNTIDRKAFAGGYLSIVGMTQPADLQGRPVATIRIDELDQAVRDAGAQGAPLRQLATRMKRFIYRNLYACGTPTTKGASAIEDEFNSTNKSRWTVPCPLCNTAQVLKWGSRDVAWGLKWNDGNPETAHYVCEHCLKPFGEQHKRWMNQQGQFVPDDPSQIEELGFWMNALVGMFDGSRWSVLVKEFLDARKDHLKLRQFINTVLCETYEDRTTRLQVNILHERLERYAAQVPHGVGVLTRAVDTQDDRLEVATFGYGADRETWPIHYEFIPGDPSTPVPWRRLDELRRTPFIHASGRPVFPSVCFIDSQGHRTDHVYSYVRQHLRDAEPTFAISGSGEENHPILGKAIYDKKMRLTRYRIGTWAAKLDILERIGTIDPPDNAFMRLYETPENFRDYWRDPKLRVAGYFHLPDDDWFDNERLRQLTESEKLIEFYSKGKLVRKWEETYANHYLDLAVYSLAGLYTFGAKAIREQLGAWAEVLSSAYTPPIGQVAPVSGRRMRSTGINVI